jgi:hypothetical protein
MSIFDKQTMALATEIAGHAGSVLEGDVEYVAQWLVNGGDDGESATNLFMKFDSEDQLPSKA